MPFEVQQVGSRPKAERVQISSDWDWMSQQDYSPDHAWSQIGQLRPGTRRMGPTAGQFDLLENPRKYAIYAPAPLITHPAKTNQEAFGKFGSVTLSEIDPFLTIESFGQGIGFSQQQASDLSGDAQTFLGERDIDPFGQGAAGVPSRLADYAVGWLGALYDHASGKPITAPMPTGDGVFQYDFQRDPAYWALIGAEGASDEFLAGVAKQVASRYSSNSGYLADQLLAQFKADRERASGRSSGDRRVDYQAKLAFTADFIATNGQSATPFGASAVTPAYGNPAVAMQLPSAIAGAIPFIGADIREATYQHPPQIEQAWAKLDNDQRRLYFEKAGIYGLVGDAVVWMPLLSGGGAVQAIAMGPRAGTTLRTAFKMYEYGRNVTVGVMATGLSVAVANWGLSASVPGYAEDFGKRLDYARPISSSAVAGLFNQMGFFASGTFGGYLAARSILRGTGKVASALHVPKPGAGELGYFRFAFGGSAVRRELQATGLEDPGLLDLAPQGAFTSHIQNWIEGNRRAISESYVKGNPTGIAKYDQITDPAARLEAANEYLLRGTHAGGNEAEGIGKVMMEARRPRPLLAGPAQRMHDAAVKLAKYVDDEMARVYIEEYGQAWISRVAGSYDRRSMEAYARTTVERLGGNPGRLGAHNEEGWAQVIRFLHQVEYHKQNGRLQMAAAGSEEAPRLLLMQADHLFAGEADRVLKVLDGDDEALAATTVASTIASRREAAAWFANEWQPPAGVSRTPANVPAAEFAQWIRDIRAALPHRRSLPDEASTTAGMPLNAYQAELEANRLWTLGFKATDEAGNPVSYVRRPDGKVFKSPWIEYPMGNQEAIDMGNRGLLLSKADGITRGFRTWRIVEFQKGLVYRRLQARLPGLAPEQIERFHAGVMRLARRTGAQPQTLGAIARAKSPIWGAADVADKIDALVVDVFGAGPHVSALTGKPINFYDEIAKGYRQAFRLNLSAGLTSFLKANLGEVGSQLAWASDIGYVMWRFNMSTIFKGGEILESGLFNPMRGAVGIDSITKQLYTTAGVGTDFAPLAAEVQYDDMVRSLTGKAAPEDPSARFAASAGFYARHLPEDFEQKAATAYAQRTAEDMRLAHDGGQLPSADWLPRRPGRVTSLEDIPADFSIKLSDHRPDLLDANELADEQSIWHATTALNRVYSEGLRARREILSTTAKPSKGEGFAAWRARLTDEERAAEFPQDPGYVGPKYRSMSVTEYNAAAKAGEFELPEGILDRKLTLTDNPDRLVGAEGDYIVEFDPGYTHTTGSFGAYESIETSLNDAGQMVPAPIDFGARNRVWKRLSGQNDHTLVYESAYVGDNVPQALGGGTGQRVSTTYREDHAIEIARRLKFASRAARNEVTNGEILEHFAELYGDDVYTMGKVLGATPNSVMDNLSGGVLKLSKKGPIKKAPQPGEIDTFIQLERWMDAKITTGTSKYEAVQNLDGALVRSIHSPDDWSGGVILAGSAEDMARLNPDEIGVVQVAARKGAIAKDGADQFELEFLSHDLLVVDDRVRLAPLAEDEAGLLAQLKETLAPEPKLGQQSIADQMVGGNGIAPGLEGRARSILTKLEDLQEAKRDGGPVFTWEDMNLTDQARAFREQIEADGWTVSTLDPAFIQPPKAMSSDDLNAYRAAGIAPSATLYERRRLDGTTEVRPIDQLYHESQQRPGAATRMEDVAGTPEAFGEALDNLVEEKGKTKRNWVDTFIHPAQYKLEKVTELQIKLARDEFPGLLRVSGNTELIRVFEGLGLSERGWLDWLVEDRRLLSKWDDARTPEAWDDLLAHAGDDRGSFDELYASDGWAALSALIGANFRSAGQEAFGVHFFAPYRSALERSINHPLLGLYPASWSIKAAREWAKFLFDNQMLGINIGMAPAQAIAQLINEQHASFAAMTGEELDTWLSHDGPLGSPIFIFNLLMPGDWSALPFALSRPVRDYSRAALQGDTMPDAANLVTRSITDYGVTRDLRLFFESIGQTGDLLGMDGEPEEPASALTKYSVRGGEWLTYDPPAR